MKKYSMKFFLKSLVALTLCLCMGGIALADVLTLPTGVRIIEEEAFYGDISLDEVVLPEGIEEIGPRAFAKSSVSSVILPSSLAYIADDAFDANEDIDFEVEEGSYAAEWVEVFRAHSQGQPSGVENFEFSDNGDGTCTVTGYIGTETDIDIVIPSKNADGLLVTKIGDHAFDGRSDLKGGLTIPDSVTAIGNNAFYNCSGFNGSLTIPDSVTTIGEFAFCHCSGFVGSLTIPDSVTTIGDYAFYNCSGLNGSLTIGNNVTTIGDEAFGYCSGFNGRLTIGKSVTKIGDYAFEYCSGINGSLTIGSSVTAIGYSAFYKCSGFIGSLTIGSSVTTIGGYAFYDCSGLIGSLTIPDRVTTIGDYAFYNCSGLTGSLTIPDSVTMIGEAAFYNCSAFTGSLTIGNSVTTIGDYAFYNCSGLTGSLTIPDSVITIGNSAFNNCSGLTGSLTIGAGVTTIGNYAFNNCSGLNGSLKIPDSMTMIGNYAFNNCSGLNGSLKIPDNVTMLGHHVFYNCSGFTGSLTIGESVTVIGQSAFENCSGFTGSLRIPDSVTEICDSAFRGCNGFTGSLTIGENVTAIWHNAFDNCSGFTGSLRIPDSVISIQWDAFRYCSGFTGSLTIGANMTQIWHRAFLGCSGLTGRLTIPASVLSIGASAFASCDSLQKISVIITAPDGTVTKVERTAVYCDPDSYAWNWAQLTYGFEPVEWDGTSDPRPEEEYLTGAFDYDEEPVTITLGEIPAISGWVQSTGNPISCVSVTILGYEVPDNSDRYASKSFAGQNLKNVSLNEHDVFTLDTTREPLNVPGDYIVKLWASTTEGTGVMLDSMMVTVSEPGSTILSGKVCTEFGDPVEGINVYVYQSENDKLFGLVQTRSDGSWRITGIPKDSTCTVLYAHSRYGFLPETQEIVMTDSLDAGPVIASLKPQGGAQCSVTFSMDHTEVNVGDPVLFTIQGDHATRVKLVVDGKEYETYSLPEGSGTFTRAFTKAGIRMVQLYAMNADGYGQLSDAQQITVSSFGSLQKAVFTNDFTAVSGTSKTISWKPVMNAAHYTLYLYRDDCLLLQEKVDEPVNSYEIPGDVLSVPGNYFIELIASGYGYEQVSSTAWLDVYARETVNVSGSFINQDQQPVSEVRLRVIARAGSKNLNGWNCQTDESGVFTLALPKNCSYLIVWSKSGYQFDNDSIEINTGENDIQLEPVTVQRLGTAELYLSAPFLVHWKDANAQTVEVFATGSWSATTDASWITISQDGNLLIVSMTENTTGEVRTGTITVSCGSASVLLPIAQEEGETLRIRSNGGSSGYLEKETAMKLINYIWGNGTITYTHHWFIISWDTYEVNSQDNNVAEYWKLLIGDKVSNTYEVKRRFVIDVETRLAMIASRKWSQDKMKKVGEGLVHYIDTNSTEELGLDLINDVITGALKIPEPVTLTLGTSPEDVAALITSAGVLKNMSDTGPAEYLLDVIYRDSGNKLPVPGGMQETLDTAPTSYVTIKLPGLSDDQMREIATVLKKMHNDVY